MKTELTIQKLNTPAVRTNLLKLTYLFGISAVTSIFLLQEFSLNRFLGGTLISFVLLFVLYRDIVRYKPAYLNNFSMLLLLSLMIIGTLMAGRTFSYFLSSMMKGLAMADTGIAIYGIPIATGAMLVALLFDFHTAITFSFTVSLLTGYWLGESFFPIYTFVGSLTAAFSVIRCKKRSALLRGGLYVILVNICLVIIFLISTGDLFSEKALAAIVFAAFSGITVAATVALILPLFEYLFKVTTDISLLELLDLNQPLMKMLMINAPGTYHHSVIVGSLVESAAEAVGVNPLLGRVSSYYHDIGKAKMPEYFVENQGGSPSKHDKLTPHMSSMIIINHVKEGVELARQYKLPQAIIDIIKQHHGSSVLTYFFQKAKDIGRDSVPGQQDYTYPGPKPQSRVAALVMMADAVEAASKVLNDPTPARIAALVDKIINHIFLEGQLDECELTLKDISEIKKRFIYILTGIMHKRVDYPGFDFGNGDSNKEPAKSEKTKFA